MGQLVVTCHPDGSVETLLKDKVFDTRKLSDRRDIERLSEILPTNDGQEFMVHWLRGPLTTETHIPGYYTCCYYSCWSDGETMYFDSYEAAVEYEVATVNALRLKGYSFV